MDDWIRFSLNCDVDPEKSGFNYSNICTYLVGVALANILGSDLCGFVEDDSHDLLESMERNILVIS